MHVMYWTLLSRRSYFVGSGVVPAGYVGVSDRSTISVSPNALLFLTCVQSTRPWLHLWILLYFTKIVTDLLDQKGQNANSPSWVTCLYRLGKHLNMVHLLKARRVSIYDWRGKKTRNKHFIHDRNITSRYLRIYLRVSSPKCPFLRTKPATSRLIDVPCSGLSPRHSYHAARTTSGVKHVHWQKGESVDSEPRTARMT